MTPPRISAHHACVAAAVRALPAVEPPAIQIEDWDALFCAVRARLRSSSDAPADRAPVIVQECVEALEQLHAMLAIERRWHKAPSLAALVIERLVKPRAHEAPTREFASAYGGARPRLPL